MNEPSAGKAPSLSLFVELTLVESDQSCLALVSSDPSCGSIVSSSITVQSTLWESETPIIWKPPASQPESDSLVSEEEDEEDDEEESEEELLALRRDGCVFVSVAGFSAEENNTHNQDHIQHFDLGKTQTTRERCCTFVSNT